MLKNYQISIDGCYHYWSIFDNQLLIGKKHNERVIKSVLHLDKYIKQKLIDWLSPIRLLGS